MVEPTKTVILLDSLRRGGVQRGVLLQAPRFDRSKYSVRVWALRSGGKNWELGEEFQKMGIPVEPVIVSHLKDRVGIAALARKLAKERIGLLSTQSFNPNIIGRIAARLAHVPAVVAHYHSTYAQNWNPRIFPYEHLMRDGTDAFVCVAKAVRDYLQPLLRLPEDRTYVIHSGVDPSEFANPPERAKTREKLKLSPDAPVIAMVGRLTHDMDIPSFVRAVPLVLDRIKNAVFVLVGEGEDRDKILNLIRIHSLHRSILLLGSQSDMPAILHAADCVVLPSLIEGFPRILLECFASRTPVIATPAGGVPEILRDGENGLSIPFSSSEAITEAILRTLLAPEETRKRCERAFRDVQAYGVDNWVRATQEVFDQAVARHVPEIDARQKEDCSLGALRLRWDWVRFHMALLRTTRRMDAPPK